MMITIDVVTAVVSSGLILLGVGPRVPQVRRES